MYSRYYLGILRHYYIDLYVLHIPAYIRYTCTSIKLSILGISSYYHMLHITEKMVESRLPAPMSVPNSLPFQTSAR